MLDDKTLEADGARLGLRAHHAHGQFVVSELFVAARTLDPEK